MKGISLALETVIMLVLGTIVLGALLAFFFGVFTPAQSTATQLQEQNQICQNIFNTAPRCGITANGVEPSVEGYADDLNKKKICSTQRADCNPGTSEDTQLRYKSCIQTCCRLFCGFA